MENLLLYAEKLFQMIFQPFWALILTLLGTESNVPLPKNSVYRDDKPCNVLAGVVLHPISSILVLKMNPDIARTALLSDSIDTCGGLIG